MVPRGETPKGDWMQLVGAAYDRSIYGFALETTQEDDERRIARGETCPRRPTSTLRPTIACERRAQSFHYWSSLGLHGCPLESRCW